MKKILIIDDEEDFCYFVKKNLEIDKNFAVSVCSDSTKAIERIKELQPDLILLDLLMPGMDGSAIAQELKEDGSTQALPIIFLTAVVKEEEAQQSKNIIGGRYFVAKPVKIKELISIINKLI